MSEEKRYFQYIAGADVNNIVIFDKIEEEDNIIYVKFKNGARCNEEYIVPLDTLNPDALKGKLIAEVENPNNIWTFEKQIIGRQEEKWELNKDGVKVCVQPFLSGKEILKAIPPKKSKPKASKFGQLENNNKIITNPIDNKEVELTTNNINNINNINDPVYLMVERSKKYDTPISMTFNMVLPTKSLFNVIKESFENGEEKFIEYIINNMDITQLKQTIKEALTFTYGQQTN